MRGSASSGSMAAWRAASRSCRRLDPAGNDGSDHQRRAAGRLWLFLVAGSGRPYQAPASSASRSASFPTKPGGRRSTRPALGHGPRAVRRRAQPHQCRSGSGEGPIAARSCERTWPLCDSRCARRRRARACGRLGLERDRGQLGGFAPGLGLAHQRPPTPLLRASLSTPAPAPPLRRAFSRAGRSNMCRMPPPCPRLRRR